MELMYKAFKFFLLVMLLSQSSIAAIPFIFGPQFFQDKRSFRINTTGPCFKTTNTTMMDSPLNNDMSISFWVKLADNPANFTPLFGKWDTTGGGTGPGWYVAFQDNQPFFLSMQVSGSDQWGPVGVAGTGWQHHVIVVRAGGDHAFNNWYINGAQVDQTYQDDYFCDPVCSGGDSNSATFFVGDCTNDISTKDIYFNDFALFNWALDQTQVDELYNGDFANPIDMRDGSNYTQQNVHWNDWDGFRNNDNLAWWTFEMPDSMNSSVSGLKAVRDMRGGPGQLNHLTTVSGTTSEATNHSTTVP